MNFSFLQAQVRRLQEPGPLTRSRLPQTARAYRLLPLANQFGQENPGRPRMRAVGGVTEMNTPGW